jgi:hypothetical protein
MPAAFMEGTLMVVLPSGASFPEAGDTVSHGALVVDAVDAVVVNFIVAAPAVNEHEMGIS